MDNIATDKEIIAPVLPATSEVTISQLPKVTTMAPTDLLEIDRNGTGAAVSYATLVSAVSSSLGLTGIQETFERIIG